ncbi:MAG: HAD family hydrolase [Clostridia bacterium]|nr:HAD family hydrolase [Clostridia bacterium]
MERPVICFDWDGTLADSMDLCIGEVRTCLLRMGLPDLSDETLRQCNGPTFEEAVPLLGIPEERIPEYLQTRLAAGLELVPQINRLFPGARELLEVLRPHADLCIVSNGTAEYVGLCLKTFHLEGVFHRIVTCRPDRTKTQNLAALLVELQPRRAVMVGDRLGDIRAGKDNGIPTIAACYGYGSEAEYAVADRRVESVAELQAVLMNFCKNI